VALLVLVYLLTENALWVSLVLGVQLLGTVVFSPLLSAWADTQDRKRLLVWSDLLRAPLVALIPLLGAKSLPVLLLLVFVIDWTYAASTCTGNRGLKSRLSLPAMSLRRHW
jgi:MFS family permease